MFQRCSHWKRMEQHTADTSQRLAADFTKILTFGTLYRKYQRDFQSINWKSNHWLSPLRPLMKLPNAQPVDMLLLSPQKITSIVLIVGLIHHYPQVLPPWLVRRYYKHWSKPRIFILRSTRWLKRNSGSSYNRWGSSRMFVQQTFHRQAVSENKTATLFHRQAVSENNRRKRFARPSLSFN